MKIKNRKVPFLRRQIGAVFQDFKLLPQKTAYENVAFALQCIGKPKGVIRSQVPEVLRLVGLADQMDSLPDQLSGGEQQRVAVARAMVNRPPLLICDEPTTALDVTIQAQILHLIRRLQEKLNLTTIYITHDLGVVANVADRIAVMYAGDIIEVGGVDEIFYDPRHPYTWGLLGALPSQAVENGELRGIPGMPPTLLDPPPGDAFAERNQYAMKIDYERMPPMFPVSETHSAATWLLDERAPAVTPPVTIKRRGMVH